MKDRFPELLKCSGLLSVINDFETSSQEGIMRVFAAIAFTSLLLIPQPSHAQNPNDPTIEACRTTGLIALKEQSPPLRDLVFDVESLAVSKTNTSVEDIRVRTVIMGEAYLERERETRGSHRFVCLVGNKGKVLLTFFTAQ